MESNDLGWSSVVTPVIAGIADHPEYGQELTASSCRADPMISRRFAEVTCLSDNRADLPQMTTPALVLQCDDDVIAALTLGRYVHEARLVPLLRVEGELALSRSTCATPTAAVARCW